ncbi:hypothetical protein F4810DRAFT_680420 [Camillea tinctor]|nr:hypothetical protein F4810DRAFT_680420 [Camillea tinctor]
MPYSTLHFSQRGRKRDLPKAKSSPAGIGGFFLLLLLPCISLFSPLGYLPWNRTKVGRVILTIGLTFSTSRYVPFIVGLHYICETRRKHGTLECGLG